MTYRTFVISNPQGNVFYLNTPIGDHYGLNLMRANTGTYPDMTRALAIMKQSTWLSPEFKEFIRTAVVKAVVSTVEDV